VTILHAAGSKLFSKILFIQVPALKAYSGERGPAASRFSFCGGYYDYYGGPDIVVVGGWGGGWQGGHGSWHGGHAHFHHR
jgi:hypothetical protein